LPVDPSDSSRPAGSRADRAEGHQRARWGTAAVLARAPRRLGELQLWRIPRDPPTPHGRR